MRFVKMQGAGNDYVYVDCVRQVMPRDPVTLAQQMSNRNFGVGSDGLILITPSERADARMRMFNADGSESEMCGNGVRCVAKFVHDHGIARKPVLTIETGRGVLTLELFLKDDRVERVRVDMGEPILIGEQIPTRLPGDPPLDVFLDVAGHTFQATAVSMGNPHCVIFVDEITDFLVKEVGPQIERLPQFPRRTNVEFVRVLSRNEIQMRVWERGSGETLACGTGACAVCVAGVLTGRTARKITAHLPGGDLELDWNEQSNRVYMTGPAVEVFTGEWPD